jgi:lysophospholipase L1-like esterase
MIRAALTSVVLATLPMTAGAAAEVFDFRAGGNASALPAYDAAKGYGFESAAPARFSIRVPEGNWRVGVRVGRSKVPGRLDIFAEQRRHMGTVVPDRRKSVESSFVVNVRTPSLGELPANATGGTQVRLKPREIGSLDWDDKLTIEITAARGALESITLEPADVPTLYLAGDSTVTDQPTAPDASWGQRLTAFFRADIAVANHAESGETLKSFVTEQRLDKLLSRLRAGDWVMIQFGHNDQKTQWPQTYADAATTYRAWLRTWLAEIRRRGATPLLVTPPERRNFDPAGLVVPTLADYADAMRAVAREERVALLDLNALSVRLYAALGPRLAPRAFADDGRDKTHFSEYGADQLARGLAEALRATDPGLTAGLEAHLDATLPRFDPDHPELPK